ncbi:hypothetical protein MMYC01_209252 [Madurella mycetomatis]|uniref:Uncharacterized protein n=1 Tax=Madurella mycetomatis TaxID=100816 RepID=A0A175VTP9_9PEZI|nr:hypothetical protein MMYC01_209252 [Madurella mycetomatis]
MGTWDSYCAICGGPFDGIQFKRAWRQAHQHTETNGQPSGESDNEDEQAPDEDDQSETSTEESQDGHDNLDSDLSDDEQSDLASVHGPIALSDSDADSDEHDEGSADWDILSSVSEPAEVGNQVSLADSLLSAVDDEGRADVNDGTQLDGNDNDLFAEDPDLEFSYDPDVIRPKDTRWTSAMYGLCYNVNAVGSSKYIQPPNSPLWLVQF